MLAICEALYLGDFITLGMEGTACEDVLACSDVRYCLTLYLLAYTIDFLTIRELWTLLANRFALSVPPIQLAEPKRPEATKATREAIKESGRRRGNGRGRR